MSKEIRDWIVSASYSGRFKICKQEDTTMTETYSQERRNFLKIIALLGGAASTLQVTGKAIAGGKPVLLLSEKPAQGYRVTPHIKKYYQTAAGD
jgi:hypothetical protein